MEEINLKRPKRRHIEDNYPAIAKLGQGRFMKMVDLSFPSIYLTLLSIIQSVAMGFLVVGLTAQFQHLGPVNILLLINTFFAIVVVWHSYLEGLLRLRWTPTIVDSLLPFSIGFVECLLGHFSDEPPWWFLLMAILLILGGLVNINAFCHLRKEDFESQTTFAYIRKNSLRSLVSRGILGVLIFPSLFLIVKHRPTAALGPAIFALSVGTVFLIVKFRKIGWE